MDWDLGLITVGLTGLAKEFGVSGKWLVLTAVLVGIAVSVLWQIVPETASMVFDAVIVGLTSAGLYGVAKKAGQALVNGKGQ